MTRYLITGVTGQIGSYAAEQLVEAGHEVYGMVRGQKSPWVPEGVREVRGDLLDQGSLYRAVRVADPEVIFNFGAVTAIGQSWNHPLLTAEVTALGVFRWIEVVLSWNRDIRIVQASTADQFGDYAIPSRVPVHKANETTPFKSRSPYGIAKQAAHDMCVAYREAYGMHISTAIQFNCTSPRHGDEFVVRKVTKAVARIITEHMDESRVVPVDKLRLGNLSSVRDWTHAADVAAAYPLIAAQDTPGDYVLASGVGHSLKELVAEAFGTVGLDWKEWVEFDKSFIRPTDVAVSVGDATKANEVLGWKPRRNFRAIVRDMVNAELEIGKVSWQWES